MRENQFRLLRYGMTKVLVVVVSLPSVHVEDLFDRLHAIVGVRL